MLLLVLAASLGLDLHGEASCESCTTRARLLIEEITDYLDESMPDMDAAWNLFETADILAPVGARHAAAAPGPWIRALVPALRVSLWAPAFRSSWSDVEWEIYLLWNVSM
jgi:hypothetical protein